MGAVYSDKCYPSADLATDAMLSTAAPFISDKNIVQFVKDSTGWRLHGYDVDKATGVRVLTYDVPAPVPAFPTCDPVEGFADGMTVGWLFASIMLGVAAIALMKRATR